MVKTYCDTCEKLIDEIDSSLHATVTIEYDDFKETSEYMLDLCPVCRSKFQSFMIEEMKQEPLRGNDREYEE